MSSSRRGEPALAGDRRFDDVDPLARGRLGPYAAGNRIGEVELCGA